MAKIYMGNGGFRGVSEIRQDRRAALRAMPQKKPLVYMGGGVSTHVVLASGGISRGGVVSVRSERATSEKPKVERAAVPVLREVKMVGREARVIEPPKVEPKGLTEAEKRAVEFFAAVEERRAAEAVEAMPREPNLAAAVDWNPPKAVDAVGVYAPAKVEEAAIEPQTEPPTMAVIPELPLGESLVSEEPMDGRRKRRRGKKNRPTKSTEVSEEKRQEFQAALEAASDAAASAG